MPSLRDRAVVTLLCGALGALLIATVVQLPTDPAGLTRLVEDQLRHTGVTSAVTAVLLDFRAYDTFLEVGVLLVAVFGALVIRRSVELRGLVGQRESDPILTAMMWLIVPIMVLTSGYVLSLGTHAHGGAFQAGAIVAAAAILVLLAGGRSVTGLSTRALVALSASGFVAFLVLAWALLIDGRRLLDLPLSSAALLTVLIEIAVAIAVAVGLAGLLVIAHQRRDDS